MTTAWVFPGQGSQSVGMGRDVYEQSAAGRAVFEKADRTLGFPLTALCFEGPEDQLTATENAQPALLTTCYALLAAAREAGDAALEGPPAFVAGHSLGEYTALLAAGALDLPTALRLVRRRGELMAAATAGTMAAILGMDEEPLEGICAEVRAEGGGEAVVAIANYNAPGQLVISGGVAAVQRAMALAKERGAKRALPLKVSAAFHSPLMAEVAAGLAPVLAQAAIAELTVPLVANVSAAPIGGAAAVREELVQQVASPVRWVASVQHMVKAGVDTFIEIGPGSVLTGLIKRIVPDARLVNIASVRVG